MADIPAGEVTRLLVELRGGNQDAASELMPVVYDELRRLAAYYLGREPQDQTVQATMLIKETYSRLLGSQEIAWQNRAHFFGIAAKVMRRILVDRAREINTVHHSGLLAGRGVEISALDRALERLSQLNSLQGRIVELRFFAGMDFAEIAEVVDVSEFVVKRHWAVAKAWLYGELTEGTDDSGALVTH